VPHLIQDETDRGSPPAAYSSWYYVPVVLRIIAAAPLQMQTGLHCIITGESDAAVHIRNDQRDQDIRKDLILAVEEIPAPCRLQ